MRASARAPGAGGAGAPRSPRLRLAGGLLLAWAAIGGAAAAQPAPGGLASAARGAGSAARGEGSAAQAAALLDDATALMAMGQYSAALIALKESQSLSPRPETQLLLARCYEKAGLVGSAYRLFAQLAEGGGGAGGAARRAEARKRASELWPAVPKLRFVVPEEVAGLPGLRVELDGQRVGAWDRPFAVDQGIHLVRATAPGKKAWEWEIEIPESAKEAPVRVSVPVLAPADPAPEAPSGAAATPPVQRLQAAVGPMLSRGASLDGYRVGAIVAGAVGLAGVGVGAGSSAAAKSLWNEALSHCKDRDLRKGCDARFAEKKDAARTWVNVAAGAFVGTGVSMATGILLLILSPASGGSRAGRASVTVTPVVGENGVATVVQGTF